MVTPSTFCGSVNLEALILIWATRTLETTEIKLWSFENDEMEALIGEHDGQTEEHIAKQLDVD